VSASGIGRCHGRTKHFPEFKTLDAESFRILPGGAMRHGTILIAILAVAAAAPRPSRAADASKPPACDGASHRQFDFWLGEWDVTNARNPDPKRPPARSHISRLLDGCAVLEEFDNPARGYSGKSLNFFAGGKWHQTWIDNQGSALFLEGGLEGASMVLQDRGPGDAANRITWTPLDGGRVRQHWEVSKDGGKTWSTVFDGLYAPRTPSP
jgi:hypothetical protein